MPNRKSWKNPKKNAQFYKVAHNETEKRSTTIYDLFQENREQKSSPFLLTYSFPILSISFAGSRKTRLKMTFSADREHKCF